MNNLVTHPTFSDRKLQTCYEIKSILLVHTILKEIKESILHEKNGEKNIRSALQTFKDQMLFLGCQLSYDIPRLQRQIEYRALASSLAWRVIGQKTYRTKHSLLFVKKKYLCIIALKPLNMLLIRDMKHTCTCNIHINMILLPRLKIQCQKLCRKLFF